MAWEKAKRIEISWKVSKYSENKWIPGEYLNNISFTNKFML